MSLATRCTSCETVFRVVQDQLKVSEGWVRCGRCDAVFNGLESLFDLNREATADTAPAAVNAAEMAVAAEASASASADFELSFGPEPARAAAADVSRESTSFAPAWAASESPAELIAVPDPEPEPESKPVAAPESARLAEPAQRIELASARPAATPARIDSTPPPSPPPTPTPTPSFLGVARPRSRWQAMPVRLALAGVSALLLIGLVGQVLHHFRDAVAARWPQTLPLLTAGCQAIGCVIAPARRISDVAVESSALTRTAEADTFTLAVALRNRGTLRVALPSLDLTLTDSAGKLVARRALAPLDFPATAATLAPGSEALLKVTLATGSPRVSGYTVEVFYP